VALHGSQSRRETDNADHNQNDWPRLTEGKTAASLLEKKEHAHGDNHCGAHQAANGTAAAVATDTVTHLCLPLAIFRTQIFTRADQDRPSRLRNITTPTPIRINGQNRPIL
jgi:hypothetical protein